MVLSQMAIDERTRQHLHAEPENPSSCPEAPQANPAFARIKPDVSFLPHLAIRAECGHVSGEWGMGNGNGVHSSE